MRSDQLHQKLGLVQQLKTLARQHEQILQAYERKVQEKLQEGSLGATAGGKRPGAPLVAEGPEAKRHRQLQERARRKQSVWDEVVKIVEKIRKNAKSEAFRQPVDPMKLKIPDYFIVIKKPMDLGTVLKKLRSKPLGYTAPSEVADDVRQIWINCRTYNGEQHPVTLAANTCSEAFEKAWGMADIEHRWQVEVLAEEREEQAFASGNNEAGDDTIVSQLRSKRNMLGDFIAAKDVQDQLPPGSLGDLAPDRDMTFEEKRKLSAHMASLPGEKLVAVLDIIQEGENIEDNGEGEFEVDIDALQNSTLWKLKAYVDGVLTATSGPPPKKSANRTAPNKQGPPAPAAAAGGMPPPPPAAAALQPGLPSPQRQQQPAAGAMPPPPQQPPQFQPPQPQQPPAAQQQPPGSPQHSGGVSAQEVVGSTAGGAGAARSHQFTYDMGTVAQSGTNARPSNFVMSNKARQPTPTADAAAAAAGAEDAAKGGPAHMDAGTAQDWEAALKDGDGPPAAAAEAGEAAAAAPAAPAGEAAAADAAGGGEAGAAAPAAAAAAAAAGPAAAAEGPAAAAAPPAAAGDAPAAADPAAAKRDASPAAAAAAGGGDAPAAAPAAAGDGSTGAAAAAGGGGDEVWDKFAEAAQREEERIAAQQAEERRRKQEAEEQKRLKEEQEAHAKQQELDARKADIFGQMSNAGSAAANDDAVQADVEKLLQGAPGTAPAPAPAAAAPAAAADGADGGAEAMEVDGEDSEGGKQQEDEEGGPADGGGFD